jgi:ribosomal protein L29
MNAKELTAAFEAMQAEIASLKAEIAELRVQKSTTPVAPAKSQPNPQIANDLQEIAKLKEQLKAGKLDGATFAKLANEIAARTNPKRKAA